MTRVVRTGEKIGLDRDGATSLLSPDLRKFIAQLAESLASLTVDDAKPHITNELKKITSLLGISSAAIWRLVQDRVYVLASYSIEGPKHPLLRREIKGEELSWLRSRLTSNKPLHWTRNTADANSAMQVPKVFIENSLHSWLALPLRVGGELIGCLAIANLLPQRMTAETIIDLQTIASLFANTLGRVENDLERAEHAGKLLAAQEEERSRIARELHDDINQRLALLAIKLQQFEQEFSLRTDQWHRVEEIREHLLRTSSQVAHISHCLHSSYLEHLGLAAALEEHCQEFARQHDIDVRFTSETLAERIPRETSGCLFRILQEALRNIAKHSQARSVTVTLTENRHNVQLSITDDGAGFVQDAVTKKRGLGLTSMQERAQLVRGVLDITSTVNEGTTIKVSVPLRARHGAGKLQNTSYEIAEYSGDDIDEWAQVANTDRG